MDAVNWAERVRETLAADPSAAAHSLSQRHGVTYRPPFEVRGTGIYSTEGEELLQLIARRRVRGRVLVAELEGSMMLEFVRGGGDDLVEGS